MSTIITVENLGKKYTLTHQQRGEYSSLRDAFTSSLHSFGKKLVAPFKHQAPCPQPLTPEVEDFWALKDISFEVKQGERIGIIGRNGAGKSTLLKILSRITEPTTGSIRIKGRVASLLEVGTGFHPELTGRENIFLNGAILGMQREEIRRKFDEIVDFAEIERFLDTPVKRYSSGMYVRLAFAVAAHLEPDILIVDEVLAVGDAQFQKKCLGKMEEVGREGRTVLFVSHNMAAIRQLCSRGILLRSGFVLKEGSASEVADCYLNESIGSDDIYCGERSLAEELNKDFQVVYVCLRNTRHEISTNFDCDESIHIEIDCVARRSIPGLYGYLGVLSREGHLVWVSDSMDIQPNKLDALPPGRYRINITIPPRSLAHGEYVLTIAFASTQANHGFHVDIPGEVVAFRLDDLTSLRGSKRQGFFSTLLAWQATKVE